ncbi:MAG: FAD binding domain-containing protein [Bryobacterales bacterium]|nr:FAD binding domain-containing protein [Bryobacterales bacterium]
MQNFEYIAPESAIAAAQALSPKAGLTAVLAGGTDLLSLMKERIERPTRVVSLRNIPALRGISKQGGGLRIGAMATVQELLDSKAAAGYASLLQAARGITAPQVRAMGTVAGDLLQRPRCWYYRNGYGLLAMHEGKPLVPSGENRYHAILGNQGPAYFVSASSLAPVLISLGARAAVTGPDGERSLAVADLFQIPAAAGERENTLQPNEIVTEVVIPSAAGWETATYEVRQRRLLDWPLVTASVALRVRGGKISEARVVLGHVAPIPWRSSAAETALTGQAAGEAAGETAGKAAVAAATPLTQNKAKVQLAAVAVKRAVAMAG